jgi:hypothetical protein
VGRAQECRLSRSDVTYNRDAQPGSESRREGACRYREGCADLRVGDSVGVVTGKARYECGDVARGAE